MEKFKKLIFTHSGALGDILYSLPFCNYLKNLLSLSSFEYIIKINNPGNFNINHPAGHVLTNLTLANFIKPLLEIQPNIKNINIIDEHTENGINYLHSLKNSDTLIINLDNFRKLPCNFSANYIPKYYFYLMNSFNYNTDNLILPSLIANTDNRAKNKIILFRSLRYHNKLISYKFLEKIKENILFIGLPEEYNNFKTSYFECEYLLTKNALEVANLINSAKLTIGNQTFFFAIAELLKVPRLLEQCQYCPNVLTLGGYGQDILYQNQFEQIMASYLK